MQKKCFVAGKWVSSTESYELRSPHTQQVIAEVPLASSEQVEQAIAAAQQAERIMREMPAYQRAEILENLVALFKQRAEEAAELVALEAGKPLTAARAEVARTIQTYQFAAEEAKRISGETIPIDAVPSGAGKFGFTLREPIGVIGAITPFNFPLNLVAHKVGPALAAGNPVVLKPAPQTPLSAFLLAELLQAAGLPAGVLSVVTGNAEVGEQIVTDDRVKMISFTGSAGVGQAIKQKAGLKRVVLELGSNAAVIVDRDTNLDAIIPRCVTGAFSYQGQVCISLQRIYVHEQQYEKFVDKFVAKTKHLTIGDPLDPTTDIAAMINPQATERALSWIREAQAQGAKVSYGGNVIDHSIQPTVMVDVPADAKIACEEVFAPIVMIQKISSLDEAISLVNDSRYGLQAGIFTDNIFTAIQAAKQLHVGSVLINEIPTFRVDHMPYGGVKESGVGREGIKYAIEEMTELKLIILNEQLG